MVFQIIQLAYPLAVMLTPWLSGRIFRRYRFGRLGYDLRLAFDRTSRRFVECLTLVLLLAFHFCYMWPMKHALWMLPSTIMTCALFWEDAAQGVMLRFNQLSHMKVALGVIVLCMFVPQFHAVCVTLAVLMAAAHMYPKKELIEMVSRPAFAAEVMGHINGKHPLVRRLGVTGILLYTYERQKEHHYQKRGDVQATA